MPRNAGLSVAIATVMLSLARAAFGFMGIKNSVVNGVTTIGFEPSTRPNVVTELVVEVPRRLTAVILDVRLPDGDGREYCAELRRRGHGMPVIMLTGSDHESDIVRGLEGHSPDILYTPAIWRYIMVVIDLIPESIFKRLSF